MKKFITLILLVGLFGSNTGQSGDASHKTRKQHMHHDMHDMSTMNQKMMEQLGAKDAQYDARFIDMMIVHHEGAVMMSKDALEKANHAELKQLAQKIITDQEKEIAQLKKWRQQWYKN